MRTFRGNVDWTERTLAQGARWAQDERGQNNDRVGRLALVLGHDIRRPIIPNAGERRAALSRLLG